MEQQILPVETVTYVDIRQAWLETKPDRIRTSSSIVADGYGITESEVIASGCGHISQRLRGDWRELLICLRALGPLTLNLRNDLISHEMVGLLDPVSTLGHRLYFKAGDSFLSLETDQLRQAYLVQDAESDHYSSLYFFDLGGNPVLSIQLPEEMRDLSHSLFSRFIDFNQSPVQPVSYPGSTNPEGDCSTKTAEQLRQEWVKLTSGQGIRRLLEEYGTSYLKLLERLAPTQARPLPKGSLRILLEVGMDHLLPFRIATHGTGSVMNWIGELTDVSEISSNLQVKGIGTNLWCDEKSVDQGWLVELPGADTPSRAEFFDSQGAHLATVTVPHSGDGRHDQEWRDIVEILVTLE
jgi:putative heme degradation protein